MRIIGFLDIILSQILLNIILKIHTFLKKFKIERKNQILNMKETEVHLDKEFLTIEKILKKLLLLNMILMLFFIF